MRRRNLHSLSRRFKKRNSDLTCMLCMFPEPFQTVGVRYVHTYVCYDADTFREYMRAAGMADVRPQNKGHDDMTQKSSLTSSLNRHDNARKSQAHASHASRVMLGSCSSSWVGCAHVTVQYSIVTLSRNSQMHAGGARLRHRSSFVACAVNLWNTCVHALCVCPIQL